MNTKLSRWVGIWGFVVILFVGNGLSAVEVGEFKDCRAELANDVLRLENSVMAREFKWNEGNLIGVRIVDKERGREFPLRNRKGDYDLGAMVVGQSFSVREVAGQVGADHLEAEVVCDYGVMQVKRVFRIYPGCPAIACDHYLMGAGGDLKSSDGGAAKKMDGVETAELLPEAMKGLKFYERYALDGMHWRMTAVEFFDRTDGNNNLVAERSVLPYRSGIDLRGNLLFAEDNLNGGGLFFVKEAPCSSVQLRYHGLDFSCRANEVLVAGVGLNEKDIKPGEWRKGYSCVVGVYGDGELSKYASLRTYEEHLRVLKADRDEMVMMNTWGDRNRDASIGEAFIKKEIAAAKNLGITHFQIDDGWQAGLSQNSAAKVGNKRWEQWEKEDWVADAKKFPNGFRVVSDEAKAAGIKLGLWFNPSTRDGFVLWERDAEIILGLHRDYGVNYFKIDGMDLPNVTAVENYRRFFDKVQIESGGEVVFNLDVTAGRRGGYFYFNKYGNLFLENRYTDWSNYYPHWTLRNLWMLSKYVPAQKLQIEFLNVWRNGGKYGRNDALAPGKVGFEYAFAVTMMAQPLAWFEATGLPAEAQATGSVIKKYQGLRDDIHAGQIFPIGDEPDGSSWTGFQSVNGKVGYVLVFRELNDERRAAVRTWFEAGERIAFECVLGAGKDFEGKVLRGGEVEFELERAMSYALYRYEIK